MPSGGAGMAVSAFEAPFDGAPFDYTQGLRQGRQGIRLTANRRTDLTFLAPYALSLRPFHDIALRGIGIPGENLVLHPKGFQV